MIVNLQREGQHCPGKRNNRDKYPQHSRPGCVIIAVHDVQRGLGTHHRSSTDCRGGGYRLYTRKCFFLAQYNGDTKLKWYTTNTATRLTKMKQQRHI